MRSSRLVRYAALTAATALALAGCGTFENGSPGGADGGLVINLQFTPKSHYALETDDALVLSQVGCLETLLTYDAGASELKPMLATSWQQSSPTSWDFKLRENVKFQDGTDLTAAAVADSLRRLLKAEAPPRAFTPKVIAGVDALDPSTVRITTGKPSALLPFRLASANTGILAPAAYTDSGIDPVRHCTGPYTPVSEAPSQSMTLERNANYWGPPAAVSHVEARFTPEGTTRATQLQTGESQIALGIPATKLAELRSNSELAVTEAFTPRTTGLYFNNSRAPFDKPELRKAVQAALDLGAIATSVYDNGAKPAVGPFSPDEAWAPRGAKPPAQDVAKAKKLLADAGYAPGQLKLTLLAYAERPEFGDLAAVVQANLAAIGITVEVRMSDYSAIEPTLLDGNYDLALLSRNHLTDIADPIGYLTADYSCNGGFNISKFCDPAVDAALDSANAMATPDERNAVYADIARQLEDNAVTAFVVHEQTFAAHRNSVRGFVDDPMARYAVTNSLTVANQ
ncbi:ABC transporter substrate-binding protein [Saccharopolyspora oryzae]|uniref:ABC transporter substrate-binding protein n=1 Tax=Saccharopolyspora oryzae TaxID=2997343 RepID=A0ABT4UWL7_9PSEU|nr:ABC transporter substrate-binding protein [Saccharopolyspora oryzae]MDA3625524.1 ABC transporter substrate-binding protein [Saccharopolyspora oryzae]